MTCVLHVTTVEKNSLFQLVFNDVAGSQGSHVVTASLSCVTVSYNLCTACDDRGKKLFVSISV